MKQRHAIILPLMSLLLGGSCTNPQSAESDSFSYQCLTIKTDTVVLSESYSASIRGRQDIEIFAQISGKITKLHVHEGEDVKIGQILFTIDQVPYKAALKNAIANVHSAQAQQRTAQLDYNSKKDLFQNKVISDYTLSQSKYALDVSLANLEQAKAQETDAKNNLTYTEVRSPANGVIGTLPFREGSLVSHSSSRPLTTVSDNMEVYVYFSIPENRLRSFVRQSKSMDEAIRKMPPVELQLNDGSIYAMKGRIESISGVINPQTGTLSVRSVFPNNAHLLWSGGNGNVIIKYKRANAVAIPQTATYEILDKTMVYRVVNGCAVATEIKVDKLSDGHTFVVQSGLKRGDTIASKGLGQIQDGMKLYKKQ